MAKTDKHEAVRRLKNEVQHDKEAVRQWLDSHGFNTLMDFEESAHPQDAAKALEWLDEQNAKRKPHTLLATAFRLRDTPGYDKFFPLYGFEDMADFAERAGPAELKVANDWIDQRAGLYAEKQPDRFEHESPLRAFTDFQEGSHYAIGKGFRPSLAHIVAYLDAMRNKEGWELVQILESTTGQPSFMFRKMLAAPRIGNWREMREEMDARRRFYSAPLGEPYTGSPIMPETNAKIATGLRQVSADILNYVHKQPWPKTKHLWFDKIVDRINGYASELDADIYAQLAETIRLKPMITNPEVVVRSKPEVTSEGPFGWRHGLPPEGEKVIMIDKAGNRAAGMCKDGVWYQQTYAQPDRFDTPAKAPYRWEHIVEPTFTVKVPVVGMEFMDTEGLAPDNVTVSGPPTFTVQADSIELDASRRDDPINPLHYAGRECADIGERLSANGYQILKYCWRLGKKDEPCQELGKGTWYGESELKLLATAFPPGHAVYPNVWGIEDPDVFLEERIAECSPFTQNIARMLWDGYSTKRLNAILEAINEERFHRECGTGAA